MHTYQIVLVEEDEKWWAYMPERPGVFGLGDSKEKASEDIINALSLLWEDGETS